MQHTQPQNMTPYNNSSQQWQPQNLFKTRGIVSRASDMDNSVSRLKGLEEDVCTAVQTL